MIKRIYIFPIFALVAANVLWGVNSVFIKIGVESIPPAIFVALRFLAASLIILPFAIRVWRPMRQKDFLLLVLSSVFYITLSAFALNLGLAKTSASNTSIIWLLMPPLLFVLAVTFLKEKLNPRALVGILIALAGALLIISRPEEGSATGPEALAGNLLIVIAVFCYAISMLICKPIMKRVGAWQVTFMNIFPGSLLIALYALTQLDMWNVSATTSRSYVALVLSTLAVVVANALFFYALRRKTVQSTGSYQYIDPFATLAAAWLLLSERPSPLFALGATLVFIGLYVVERRQPKPLTDSSQE